MGKTAFGQRRRCLPAEVVLVLVAGEKRIDDPRPDVLMARIAAAVFQQVEQHPEVGRGRKKSRVSGDAAIRVERIPVVDFAIQNVLAPPVPCRRIIPVAVAECGIVHHVALVDVALFRRREFGEAVRSGIEGRRP